MSNQKACMFCENSNPDRVKENIKIRCERYSEWHFPDDVCKEYFDRDLSKRLEEIKRRKEGDV